MRKIILTALILTLTVMVFSNAVNMSVAGKYFKAVGNNDLESYIACFSDDAELTVVSRTFRGHDGIRRFSREVMGGRYELLRAIESGNNIQILLQFTPKGWNNPEPMAVYNFTIIDNQITKANLQYATQSDKDYFRSHTLEQSSLIPVPFRVYLEAVRENNAHKLADSFIDDAIIRDVSRNIGGRTNIIRWTENEVLSLEYKVGKVIYTKNGAEIINRISFGTSSTGFYGSYKLDIENHQITYADLQYSDQSEFNY